MTIAECGRFDNGCNTVAPLTVGVLDLWPSNHNCIPYVQAPQWHVTLPPQMCSGEVHVFPCPHCATCKCGAATVKRQKAK